MNGSIAKCVTQNDGLMRLCYFYIGFGSILLFAERVLQNGKLKQTDLANMLIYQSNVKFGFLSSHFWDNYINHGIDRVRKWLIKVSKRLTYFVSIKLSHLQGCIADCDIIAVIVNANKNHWMLLVSIYQSC